MGIFCGCGAFFFVFVPLKGSYIKFLAYFDFDLSKRSQGNGCSKNKRR